MAKNLIVAFTGHRPQSMYGYNLKVDGNRRIIKWLRQHMERLVKHYDHVTFISGGALGVDTWAAEIALRLRKELGNCSLLMAIPCKNQDSRWPAASKKVYRRLLDEADEVHYVSEKTYDDNCMQDRNEYMVDNATALIAVWDGKTSGGTFNCLEYADDKRIPKLVYDPLRHVQTSYKSKERIFN